MFETQGWRRFGVALEFVICGLLVTVIAVNALRRMDYLSADGAQTIRMTDASRTALVARNIVEGNGYTATDLPAALLDFYDQRGKLHEEHWVNADRFPFASYATAVLYAVTGSTSWFVGILVYNLICFIGFAILLYHCGRSLWGDRYAGMAAVAIALLHPYTYMFLYWKDSDMLLLTIANMAMLYRYFQQPAGTMRWHFAVGLGTLFAWLFLSRPNLGAPFILVFGIVTLSRIWHATRGGGFVAAVRHHATRELLVLGVALVWCLPFVIHSLREWGQPLFSANNLYQLPLGTRFGMGTDTWWKYTEPGHTPTLGTLMHDGTGELARKFTSSWVATLKHVALSYPVEIALAFGLIAWLRRRASPEPLVSALAPRSERPARVVAWIVVFALLANLAILPMYGYQYHSYRHYMAFGLPLLWLLCGRALTLLAAQVKQGIEPVVAHVARRRAIYIAAAVIGVLAINVGIYDSDANRLFGRISSLIGIHWIGLILVISLVLIRMAWLPRLVIIAFAVVFAVYRPNTAMKRLNLVWRTADEGVWKSLRKRDGIVASFALQGEVAWNTGRKNIEAPEWPMHIYSFAYDHKLAIEDVYIESAAALVSTIDGPFSGAAPGFEGYARLQRWRSLPGYEAVFHGESNPGYPRFRVKPRYKASTDFVMTDRAQVAAMARSPDRIALSDPGQVIYTAHGWASYYTIDGKSAVAGTDVTRRRYPDQGDAPYEDAGITFFLDDRRPTSVDLEIYAAAGMTYQWFWNLDLYAYDRVADRPAHGVGSYTATEDGWQRVHLVVPAEVTRKGLNKLGFRTRKLQPTVLCPPDLSDDDCLDQGRRELSFDPKLVHRAEPLIVRSGEISEVEAENITLFAGAVEFHYGNDGAPREIH